MTAEATQILVDATMQVLRFEPGDILVISNVGDLTNERFSQINDAIRQLVPETVKTMVFGQDVQVSAIRGIDTTPGE